jgi:hypothetical protein
MLPLMWPYMPAAVRSRVSARTASMVLGIALPFVLRARRRSTRVHVEPDDERAAARAR